MTNETIRYEKKKNDRLTCKNTENNNFELSNIIEAPLIRTLNLINTIKKTKCQVI